ncbi:hypothetical protein ACLOJK_005952 [Asimina triloba]
MTSSGGLCIRIAGSSSTSWPSSACVVALVFSLVFRPSMIQVYVDEATLTHFNVTTTVPNNTSTALYYNLSVAMSVKNPNSKIGIYYRRLEAAASYDGDWFASVRLPAFYQLSNNTTNLHPVIFAGQVTTTSGAGVSKFNREKEKGCFSIRLYIYTRVRFKIGPLETNRYKLPDFMCKLSVPLTTSNIRSSSAATAVRFTRTNCHFRFLF